MQLHSLKYKDGSRRHKVKTYSRGPGGVGKRGGKGNKGQRQRKSGKVRLGFEGGQTPIYRKIPKVGFNNNVFSKKYNVISLKEISHMNLEKISYESLLEIKAIWDNHLPLKIIGKSKLNRTINVLVNKISKGAKECIEQLGGKVEIIE